MTTSSWDRTRRVAAAASVLALIAALAAAVVLAFTVDAPATWWPHTGRAFATGTHTAHPHPCASITGPAKKYCERGTTATAAGRRDVAGAVWRLVPAGAGAAALVVWRRRTTTGRRRH